MYVDDPRSGQRVRVPEIVLSIARDHCTHVEDPEDEDEDPCMLCILDTLHEEEP